MEDLKRLVASLEILPLKERQRLSRLKHYHKHKDDNIEERRRQNALRAKKHYYKKLEVRKNALEKFQHKEISVTTLKTMAEIIKDKKDRKEYQKKYYLENKEKSHENYLKHKETRMARQRERNALKPKKDQGPKSKRWMLNALQLIELSNILKDEENPTEDDIARFIVQIKS